MSRLLSDLCVCRGFLTAIVGAQEHDKDELIEACNRQTAQLQRAEQRGIHLSTVSS